jgi:RluA family pseudouridine synthase
MKEASSNSTSRSQPAGASHLPVLYEDEALIVFAKPSGLLTAPDRWDTSRENLMAIVHARWSPDWFNAHRLDRGTSGAVLCAKTPEALRAITAQFDRHEVEKRYLALTRGQPAADRGVVEAPLAPDGRRPGRMRVDREGKESATEFEVLERWRGGLALLRLRPLSGRTHQVRVHLAHLGCPVLGDPDYGGGRVGGKRGALHLSEFKRGYKRPSGGQAERPLIDRLALHAESLGLTHPVTGERLVVAAPLPADLAVAIKQLRRYAA